MSSIFKIFEERDIIKQENLRLKNENRQLRQIIDRKDEKICELNIKLVTKDSKLAELRDWCDNL